MPAIQYRSLRVALAFLMTGASIATAPAFAQNFNFGGMVGGIVQGAIQSDLQRQQIELERQRIELERQRLLQSQQSAQRPVAPPAAMDNLPDDGPVPDTGQGVPSGSTNYVRLYRVDRVVLGDVATPRNMPKEFKCRPSEQFAGFQWCGRARTEKGVAVQAALLKGPSGGIAYYAKYYASARFETGAIDDQINRLSALYHERPRLLAMPRSADGSSGVIAAWGNLTLSAVDAVTYRDLAAGNKVVSGVMIDYLSNARESAKRGLPVYRIGGGPGFFWVARLDPNSGGMLRFGIADATVYDPPRGVPSMPPAPATVPIATAPVAPTEAARTMVPVEAPARPTVVPMSPAPAPSEVAIQTPAQPATPVAVATSPSTPPSDVPAQALSSGLPDQGKRVALVIGNAAYRSVGALPNPSGDAEAVAATLRSVGFSVKLVEDVTLQQFKDAMRDFQAQADDADWAMVYYAGHGIEISGQNYLIPVDAHLKTDQDADDEAVTLRYVLDKMHNARKLRLVILDACRENPFQSAMKRQVAARAVARGLAPYEPRVANEMVVYAAKDGEQAQDGSSAGHSPFAKALVARMAMPGIEINKVFRLVTADVLADTGNQQQPFVYGSTPGVEDFYFRTK